MPPVRPHTLAVLADLDGRALRNHVLVITRHQMKPSDIGRLNQLVNLKVTLLFTYSGIEDQRTEPYPSAVAAASLELMSAPGAPVPDRLVLAPAGAGPERHRRAPGAGARAEPAGRRHSRRSATSVSLMFMT